LSQAKTPGESAAAAVHVSRISLAETGRGLHRKLSAKHRIKRARPLTANTHIEISGAVWSIVSCLVKRRNKPLPVSFDRTEIRSFPTLLADAATEGNVGDSYWGKGCRCAEQAGVRRFGGGRSKTGTTNPAQRRNSRRDGPCAIESGGSPGYDRRLRFETGKCR